MRIFICLFILCTAAFSETLPEFRVAPPVPGARIWKASLVTLAVANALDSQSSWGKCEGNALLADSSGRFGFRAAGMKSAMLLGLTVVEHLTGRRNPKLYRYFSAVNFSVGGGMMVVAAHNYHIPVAPANGSCSK
jgi:hypothetical protein